MVIHDVSPSSCRRVSLRRAALVPIVRVAGQGGRGTRRVPRLRAAAQSHAGLDPATLLNPPADSWPTYHGDYTGQRHSRLTQITPDNVHKLTLAWTFQTGQSAGIKSTPILVNGVMYVTAPDNIWAIDARNGRQLWRYTYPTNQGFHIGHRGAAVYQGHRLPDDAGRASGGARRAGRQGQVGRGDRGREEGLLVDERAAARSATI